MLLEYQGWAAEAVAEPGSPKSRPLPPTINIVMLCLLGMSL